MSEHVSIVHVDVEVELDIEEERESKLSLVIRRVQEGKTTICITDITKDTTKNIHIVLTMNTLSSGMQFFGRMEEKVGSGRIIVFNSNKKTAGNCHHAKDVTTLFSLMEDHHIKVIVCCAHEKRIRESIPKIFSFANRMAIEFKPSFVIHIDEAHKYISENRDYVRNFDASPVVTRIIGYSGSPEKIWSLKREDPLFHKILIRDVQEELQIFSSPHYFSINSCEHIIIEAEDGFNEETIIETAAIAEEIPEWIRVLSDMNEKHSNVWYGETFWFDLGNEMLFLSYLCYILPFMGISQEGFSYNFVPAYTRKATHYKATDIILEQFPEANVIVMNGNGMTLFRLDKSPITGKRSPRSKKTDNTIRMAASPQEKNWLLEPAYMIQKLIEGYNEFPTFITGQTCVGMSVTLINEDIGNFDNVVMAHQQFSKDKLYQLCRFLFNYTSWSAENRKKIKKTKIYSLKKIVIDTILGYEEEVEIMMSSDFTGKSCSLNEIKGEEPEQPSDREIKSAALNSIILHNQGNLWKEFKVYDGNDEEQWDRVNQFYREKIGKNIPSKSKPKKIDPNTEEETQFYYCSTTQSPKIQRRSGIISMKTQSWWSTFQLVSDKLVYARIFVGYENLEVPTEYSIYVKYVQLEDNDNARDVLNLYGKKEQTTASSDAK